MVDYADHFVELGYVRTPAAPLIRPDLSLMFANSSMVPLKPVLAAGNVLVNSVQSQQCFRARFTNTQHGFSLVFRMIGVAGMENSLPVLLADLHQFWMPFVAEHGELAVVAHPDERWITDEWLDVASGGRCFEVPLDDERFNTRWGYGHEYALHGAGINIVHIDHTRDPCSRECDISCLCGRNCLLANVISVTSPAHDARYIEVGFSEERLETLSLGGNSFNHPRYAPLVEYFASAGAQAFASLELTNLVLAAKVLLEEGGVPGPKGAEFVIRKVLRRYGSILREQVGEGQRLVVAMAGARRAEMTQMAIDCMVSEVEAEARSRSARLTKARRMLADGPLTADVVARIGDELGLSGTELSDLGLQGSAEHAADQYRRNTSGTR